MGRLQLSAETWRRKTRAELTSYSEGLAAELDETLDRTVHLSKTIAGVEEAIDALDREEAICQNPAIFLDDLDS